MKQQLMKLILTMIVTSVFGFYTFAQLSFPDGIVWDAAKGKYIVVSSSNSTFYYFNQADHNYSIYKAFNNGEYFMLGRAFVSGDYMYYYDNPLVHRIYLSTDQIDSVGLTTGSYSSDIVVDKDGNVFVSDADQPMIFKIDAANEVLVEMAKGKVAKVLAMDYDEASNSIFFTSRNKSNNPIEKIEIISETVITVYNTGLVGELSSIVRDKHGNTYVMNSNDGKVIYFDPAFSNGGITFITLNNQFGYGDMVYNSESDSIAIVDQTGNSVIVVAAIKPNAIRDREKSVRLHPYFNADNSEISLILNSTENNKKTIYLNDLQGREIMTWNLDLEMGNQLISLPVNKNLTSGLYIISVIEEGRLVSGKLRIL